MLAWRKANWGSWSYPPTVALSWETFLEAPPSQREEGSGFLSEELPDQREGLRSVPGIQPPLWEPLPQHSAGSSDPELVCLPGSRGGGPHLGPL